MAALLVISAGCGTSSGPDAPNGLTVTGTSPITLSWDIVSGASSYRVYRGTVSGAISSKTRLASNITETTYTDTSAIQGITYYYQVTAVASDDSVSNGSNEVIATSQSQTGNSFALGSSSGSGSGIVLVWSNISGAVSYNVYRGTVSAIITNKVKIASGILTTTHTDTNVTSGTTYYYQVTAVNSNGIEFDLSNEAHATSS
jgi:cellulose 1,4-beta-cellobiosidase